jgi:hypothetical protein
MDDAEKQATYREFEELVNMTPSELERWLETDESKSVGQKDDGGESTGHASGRRIVKIARSRKSDLTDDDYAHMRKVVGYIERHTAQRPDRSPSELAHMPWRYSLMNWGHDPLKG